MTTLYRITLFARAESVAEVQSDLATTLGYSQIDPSLDSVTVEPEGHAALLPTIRMIPTTCGDCDDFERWNDGSCTLDENVCAERTEAPPLNCPKRSGVTRIACPTCGRKS